MTRPRLTIAHLMAVVFLLAIAFAVVARSDDPAFYVGAILSPVIFLISAVFAEEFARHKRVRNTWVAFAFVGWLWILVIGAVKHQSLGIPLCGVAVAGAALGYFVAMKNA